jgi:phage gp46-like protein
MSDLALRWDATAFAADLAIEANDLARDGGLETAILLSLFTDRRAEPGDPLPDGESDRRGWWADAVPVVEGDQIGSRLWLLSREKETKATLSRAEEYGREALGWLIEDRVAERVEVTAEVPRGGMLGLEVVIYRPQADPVRYRFNHAWGGDSDGLVLSHRFVPVVVDLPPSAPVITSPTDGGSAGATEPFTGTADPGATVELYRDGVLVGTAVADASGAWSLPNVPTE